MKRTLALLTILSPALLALPAPSLLRPAPEVPPMSPPQSTPALQKITPFLWFDDDAEEAIRFYGTLFPDAKVLSESRWGKGGPVPEGTLMVARFRLAGQEFMALNGGPTFALNEAFSMYVNCETQEEIDRLWEDLTADGGEESMCGWLKDRFGLWWQLVPSCLPAMLTDPDPARAARVQQAMMGMRKLDIATLKEAHGG